MHTDFRADGVNWITNQIKSCPVSLSSLEFLISRSSHSMLDVVLKREPNFEIQMNWFLKRSHHSLSMHISLMRKNGIYIDRTPSGGGEFCSSYILCLDHLVTFDWFSAKRATTADSIFQLFHLEKLIIIARNYITIQIIVTKDKKTWNISFLNFNAIMSQ